MIKKFVSRKSEDGSVNGDIVLNEGKVLENIYYIPKRVLDSYLDIEKTIQQELREIYKNEN